VTVAGTIGCTVGSVIGYWIGLKDGRAEVQRYGKVVSLNDGHLDSAERWLNKYGAAKIFLTRLLPVIRTYISFPAGMAKMKFWPFIILSAIGSAIWCFILAYIGFLLGPDWDSISGAYNVLTIIVLGAQGLVVFIYIYRKRKKRVTGEDGERKVKVWRDSPNLWLRRSFCNLRKEYGEAIVKRGPKAYAEARYTTSSSNARD
jgi:membrane protein DedA with SNARE-associated domain